MRWSRRVIALAFWSVVLSATCAPASEETPVSMNSLAGIEIVAVSIPADWRSEIIQAAERGQIDQLQQQVLCNGGYFDAQGNPDGLVISGSVEQPIRRGRLRNEPPYSGFLWADTAGTVHIAKTNEAPRDVAWAIQAGPMLVENGQSGINRSTSAAFPLNSKES